MMASLIEVVHTLTGFAALATGAANLLLPKGTRRHRLIGAIYAVSMIVLLLTSFAIFDLFGGFGPYHVLSIVSLVTLGLALYFPLFKRHRTDWLHHHYMWVCWSYVGLVMATNSHLFVLGPPGWPDWARIALWWGTPAVLGMVLINRQRKPSMRKAMANMRQDRKGAL